MQTIVRLPSSPSEKNVRIHRDLVVAAALLLFLLCAPFPRPCAAISSVNVPLDSWVYPALEKLAAMGYVQSAIWGMKPFSRVEVGRLLVEARNRHEAIAEGGGETEFAGDLLERLVEAFDKEIRFIQYSDSALLKSRLKPAEEPRLHYRFVEDRPRNLTVTTRWGARLFATEGISLLGGNEGIPLDGRNNLALDFGVRGGLFGLFSMYYHPVLVARFERFSGEADRVAYLSHRGHVKLNLGKLEIMAGRESLQWGQGWKGNLLLSNNAPPLDMVQISSSSPFQLPWYFRYIGQIKAALFLSELESSRVIGHPLFLGIRVCIRPHPIIEIGLGRTIIFGGKGVPSVGARDFFKILAGENLKAGADNSNHLAGFDLRLTIPFLRNTEVYGEHYGEDEAGGLPSRNSLLVGVYVPRITADGRLDLRVEVTRTHLQYAIHHVYRSGYTYNGLLLGHPIGPNALSLFGRSTFYFTGDARLGVDFEYAERKPVAWEAGVDETIYRGHIDFEYGGLPWLDFLVGAGFERGDDFEHVEGTVRDVWSAHITVRSRF